MSNIKNFKNSFLNLKTGLYNVYFEVVLSFRDACKPDFYEFGNVAYRNHGMFGIIGFVIQKYFDWC